MYQTNEPIFIFFIALPALEIFLFIKIGGQVGALNTVALYLTAIIGVYFAKLQGIQTLNLEWLICTKIKYLFTNISGASIAILHLIIPGFLI